MREPWNAACTCGHVRDEHSDDHGECEVDNCPCVHFEWNGDDEDEGDDE